MHINIEFKARCGEPDRVREILTKQGAEYKGRDHQIDVYFNVPNGRLKLRKGNIENSLIWYEREDHAGAKQSNVGLLQTESGSALEGILTAALGVKVTVDKQRDIYFIGNVKFHVDEVEGLGTFVEVEAIDKDGTIGKERLQEQCDQYRALLGIRDAELIAESYSDLLLRAKEKP
jgi:predicted adenylyl cyclase CyaB